jgi:hypothetical protein
MSEARLGGMAGNHPKNLSTDLPSRSVFEAGRRRVELRSPFSELEKEILDINIGFRDRRCSGRSGARVGRQVPLASQRLTEAFRKRLEPRPARSPAGLIALELGDLRRHVRVLAGALRLHFALRYFRIELRNSDPYALKPSKCGLSSSCNPFVTAVWWAWRCLHSNRNKIHAHH